MATNPGPDANVLAQAIAEERYQTQKLALYRARMYAGRATSETRLRELERAVAGAQANLRRLRQEPPGDRPGARP